MDRYDQPPITYRDIEDLANHDDYLGFGYLGHGSRNHDSDLALANAANANEITIDEVFEWANSKCGRWFMDQWGHRARHTDFALAIDSALVADLPELLEL